VRIMLLPVIAARNVQAAPSYNWFLAFRRFALERDPSTWLYVLVPEILDGSRWQKGADWSGPNTTVVPVPMAESQFDDLALVTRAFWEMANEQFGWAYFDVIVSERPMLAPMLRKLASFHVVSKSRQPLVVTRDQIVVDSQWFKVSLPEELLQVVGYASAPTVFQSPQHKARAMQVTARHLSPAHLRRLDESSMVFPLGLDCADVDAVNSSERSQKPDDVVLINYSHKLFMEQKFLQSLKIMDSVLAGGRAVQLQIVTGSSAGKMVMLKQARQYSYIRTHGSANRSQFLRQMARAHVFISTSWYEDFSATVAEQIWTGLIPVLVDEDWSRYLTPPGYPYLFRSMDEGQAMLRYVVDHLAEVTAAWQDKLRDHVRQFDLSVVIPAMVEWLAGLHRDRLARLPASASLVQLLADVWDVLPAEFGPAQVYAAIKDVSENLDVLRFGNESRSTSPWLCLDLLRRAHPELVDLGGDRVRWSKP
jgi:hypothetical protein